MKMSVVYMSFIGIIVLIVRESVCDWEENSGDGRRLICGHSFIVRIRLETVADFPFLTGCILKQGTILHQNA